MNFWLLKSEPTTWSWDDQVAQGVEPWNGIRNYQARNYLKAMTPGDRCFFYHSQSARAILGIVEVVSEYRLDPTDPTGVFGLVDVKTVAPLKRPVTLAEIKHIPELQNMVLVKQSRLSVQPIFAAEWDTIMAMSEHSD